MKIPPAQPEEFALILENAEGEKKQIYFENPTIESNNAIQDELESFADSIENEQAVQVSLEDGKKLWNSPIKLLPLMNKLSNLCPCFLLPIISL